MSAISTLRRTPADRSSAGRSSAPCPGATLAVWATVWCALAVLLAGCVRIPGAQPDLGFPRQGSGHREDVDPRELAAFARRHARALRAPEIFGGREPVLYAGEDHRDPAAKAWLAAHLGHAKAAGIVALGLEAIGSRRQLVLDAYLARASTGTALRRLLREEWGHVPNAYLALIAAARDAGLGLLAIDRRSGRREGLCRLRDPNCRGRDCHMVDRIAGFKPSASTRLLVLIGSEHARAGRQPRHLRELHGLGSRSYRFTTNARTIGRILRDLEGVGGVFVPADRNRAGYDGFIAVPTAGRRIAR